MATENTTFSDVLELINSFEAAGDRTKARLTNKRAMISTQLDTAKSAEDLSRLSGLVSSYDRDVKNLGYDEFNIGGSYQDKLDAFNQADTAYEEAKAYQNENLGDEDVLYNKIMGMSWGETNAEIAKLNGILDRMGGGVAYKHSYKPNNQYTGTSLKNSITKRVGQLQNKLNVFKENEGEFLVYKEDGSFDEIPQQIYDELQFKILSGDTKGFDAEFEEMYKYAGSQYDKQEKLYLAWEQVRQQVENGQEPDLTGLDEDTSAVVQGLLDKGLGKTKDQLLDPGWVQNRVTDAKNAADKYNSQYEVLTGDKRASKTPWDPIEIDPNEIGGFNQNNPVNMTGKGTTFMKGIEESLTELTKPVSDEVDLGGDDIGGDDIGGDDILEPSNKDDSEGIDSSNTMRNLVILGGAAALPFDEQVKKAGKIVYSNTKKAASWIKSSTNFTMKETDEFFKTLKGKTESKTLKSIDKLETKLKNETSSSKRKAIKKQISTRKTKLIENVSKKLKKEPKDVARLFKSQNMSKWNIFNLKQTLLKDLPKAVVSSLKLPAKVGLGVGQVRTGAAVADAFGLDLGEGVVADVAETAVGTAAAHQAVKQTTKRFLPKLGQMLMSEKGKKFLIKKIGKKAVTKIGVSIASGGGVASLVTGLIGLGLSARDIYKAVKDYKEE